MPYAQNITDSSKEIYKDSLEEEFVLKDFFWVSVSTIRCYKHLKNFSSHPGDISAHNFAPVKSFTILFLWLPFLTMLWSLVAQLFSFCFRKIMPPSHPIIKWLEYSTIWGKTEKHLFPVTFWHYTLVITGFPGKRQGLWACSLPSRKSQSN